MPYIGKSPLHGNYSKLDDFSGDFDGSDATHALAINGISLTPVTEAAVLISINGVLQEPVTDYTVSGTNITFTTAPASTASFFGVVLGEQLAGNTPSNSTVTAAKLAGTFFTGATDIGAAIVDADLFLMDDGAGGTLRKTTASRIKTYAGGATGAGFKNLWHNGDFSIAQRGTSVTGLGITGGYQTVDGVKHNYIGGETGRFTASQSTTVPANSGHRNSFKIDVTTADSSIAASHMYYLELPIEAQECSHLKYGESGAESLAISFWVRSTTTGDYQFMIQQLDTTRQYSTTYNIASADTWEQKTIIIAGDTSGVINNDTGVGMTMTFTLTGGSTFRGGTEDAWASNANNMYAAGMTLNLFSSTSNDWYIAGLQIEIGAAATGFAFEPHSVTLARCYRYLELWPAHAADQTYIASGYVSSTSAALVPVQYVAKRATPALVTSAATDLNIAHPAGAVALTGIAISQATTKTARIECADSGSGFTSGQPCNIYLDATDGAYIGFSSEL